MTRATYSIFFDGVLHGIARNKGDALDMLYRIVANAQHHNTIQAIRGSNDSRIRADKLGTLLSMLASVIPDARRECCKSRYVLSVPGVTIRRDYVK